MFIRKLIILIFILYSGNVIAEIDNAGLLDNVLSRYASIASTWEGEIVARATSLFWNLVIMSMVWTFGLMALKKAEMSEFFAEFLRFTVFTGFYWWLLLNGPDYANSIVLSMRQMAGNATGNGLALSPSTIIDIGFGVLDRVLRESSLWSPVDSVVGLVISLVVLVILALVAVDMLILITAGWVLAYGGVFYLGFGGANWTQDIAINYFKTVLGIGMQLFTLILIVGIGQSILSDYYANMSDGLEFGEMAVILVVAVVLYGLVAKLPPMMAGIITGSSIGSMGGLGSSSGSVLSAAGAAAAVASMGAEMAKETMKQTAGGASAVMEAVKQAQENVSSGNDVLSSLSGSSFGGSQGEGGSWETPDASGSWNSAFADASGGGSMVDDGGSSPGGGSMVDDGGSSPGGGSVVDDGSSSPGGGSVVDDGGSSPGGGSVVDDGGSSAGGGSVVDDGGSSPGGGSVVDDGGSSSGGVFSQFARIAADASANLAAGSSDVMKEKANESLDSAREAISETAGGKVASAIRERNNGDSENSISGK